MIVCMKCGHPLRCMGNPRIRDRALNLIVWQGTLGVGVVWSLQRLLKQSEESNSSGEGISCFMFGRACERNISLKELLIFRHDIRNSFNFVFLLLIFFKSSNFKHSQGTLRISISILNISTNCNETKQSHEFQQIPL